MITPEKKKEIVINNYFKSDCDINTTIKEAYTKGFERGLQKTPKRQTGKWIERKDGTVECSACGQIAPYEANSWGEVIVALKYDFCPWCGADMRKTCDDQERLNNERLDRE